MKGGACGANRIHPSFCLYGSALNSFPLFLMCHHREIYKESCDDYEAKGNQVPNVREGTYCLLPKLLEFLIKAQPAGQIYIFFNSATGNGNTSEYPAAT